MARLLKMVTFNSAPLHTYMLDSPDRHNIFNSRAITQITCVKYAKLETEIEGRL